MIYAFGEALALAAKDYERTKAIVDGFGRPEIRVAAQLSIIPIILSK